MLIAMMDHTQEINNSREKEWLRQVAKFKFYLFESLHFLYKFFKWGRQVLMVEQNINTRERLKRKKNILISLRVEKEL